MVQKPDYVINGFLDSGKSSFFSYTIAQPYFQTSGTTLLIVCEEGEVEYSDRLLRQTNTEMEVFENEEDLTPSAMFQEVQAPESLETGTADHCDRCIHILNVFHEHEISSG